MKKQLKLIAICVTVFLLSGCISIRSEKYYAVKSEELKVSSHKKEKLFIEWDFSSSLYGQQKREVIDKIKSDQKAMFSDVIKESDCCEIVDKKEQATIFVKGGFYNESSNVGMFFAGITGFSLYTIPSWINSKMRISAKVENGKNSKEYNVSDSMFFAQWLPLVVVPIFAGNQLSIETEVNKNLYKTLLVQMKNDGFFVK